MTRRALPLALIALTGCMSGPDYRAPPVPATAGFAAATPVTAGSEPLPDQWWRLYDDPALDALVQQAFVANTDVRVATANLRRARAVLSETKTLRLPTTDINAAAGVSRQTVPTTTGPQGFDTDFYRLGFDMSYEIDLYGRVARSVEAARADADAAAAERDVTLVAVAAEVARAYADACSGARQTAVAEESLKIQTQSFSLTEKQYSAGRGSRVEISRARAQLELTKATLPIYAANRRNALYRLNVLIGQPPETPIPSAEACQAPPRLKQPIPTGDGTALLKRRPDVRRADRQLAAATARIGVETASLYPQIKLGLGAATQALDPAQLFNSVGNSFSIGPLLNWTFPNIAATKARIRQAEATNEAALATFDGTVLTALQETETALSNYAAGLDRNAALRAARDESATAAKLVNLRYEVGADAFLNVLDAQRTLADTEQQLAQSDADLSTAQITLFQALGGGWENVPVAPPPAKPGK
jgi:NodT family efflux transporter outer membrane factor (OMF) lipoprotein